MSDKGVHGKRLLQENRGVALKSRKQARTEGLCIDPKHLKILKPHQVEGVEFLMSCLTRSQLVEDALPSGAILADDVGTGKTLIGIITMFTLTRHFNKKGIIVCPSSLILNWKNEIKKWFPESLYYSAVFVLSNHQSDQLVYQFIHSSPESRPLLIISYDLFRSFAEALNTLTNLDYLLCDEGHRLKNAYGTKTIDALNSCVATKRIIMTGTPIQNNLEELYAIVQFVCPFYLGSLEEFRAKYIASQGTQVDELKGKLSCILLRRSKDSILSSQLPPRHEFIIRCPMLFESEKSAYIRAADESLEMIANGECQASVLPKLMELRMLCTLPPGGADDDNFAGISTKFKVLMTLIGTSCREGNSKIVIVSGFTAVLDAIQKYLRKQRCTCFRIDGSVSLDRRDKIVKAFNSPTNPIQILLLSAKAGGVGLTLTGANHICLMEPDWNPSVDTQAAGRVWRQGQSKTVYIYRIVMNGTVEESMIQRQSTKKRLGAVIGDAPIEDAELSSIQNAASFKQLILPISNDTATYGGYTNANAKKFPFIKELIADIPGIVVLEDTSLRTNDENDFSYQDFSSSL